MAKKDDSVVVVRGDGKEFTIQRDMVAEHINRGFTVKNKADQPSEDELKKAVGFNLKKAPQADAKEETVPEEKAAPKKAIKKAA